MGHPIDAGNSALDQRPTIRTDAGESYVGPTLLSVHDVSSLCLDERIDCRQPTWTPACLWDSQDSATTEPEAAPT